MSAKRSLSQYALILLCIVGGVSGCSAQQPPPASQRSIEHLAHFVQQPKDFETLLSNIKQAFDSGLPLRDDFYNDAVLLRYFGGRAISHSKPPRWGQISGFGSIAEPLEFMGTRGEGLIIYFRKTSEPGRPIFAELSVSVPGRTSADISVVQMIFGTKWQVPPPEVRPFHGLPNPPTRPGGNMQIVYSLGQPGNRWYARFEFAPDATVRVASFWTEEANVP